MKIFDSSVTESEEPFAANGSASQYFHRDEHAPKVVSSDAALMALQEDVVKLEKSIIQLKQLKQEAQKQQMEERMQHLQEQAERINALAEQLAAEMVKFQEMAQQVNRDCHAIHAPENQGISLSVTQQNSTRPDRVWEAQDIAIPTVVKRGFQFVLTTIKVEKPGSEEENASQRAAIAQQRREALEGWLEARRQRIIDNFPVCDNRILVDFALGGDRLKIACTSSSR